MWRQLRNQLVSILDANALIADVYDYEAEEFKGDPVALVTPSGNESEFETTTDNRRIYAFTVRLLIDRTSRNSEDCESALRDLTDTVLDDFDKNYTLTGITNPTGKTLLFVEALPSDWGYIEGQVVYRFADIAVRCHVSVDTTLIS